MSKNKKILYFFHLKIPIFTAAFLIGMFSQRILTTTKTVPEGTAKLDGHGAVEYGVDGAVGVNERSTEQQVPFIEKCLL